MTPVTRRPPFSWSPAASRYRSKATGRFVPRAEVRRAIDQALLSEQRRMRTLAGELRGNRITIAQWQTEMRSALKELHTYSAAAARGGFGQMGAAEYGQVGQRLREQYRYLDGFAKDIEGGLPLDGRFTGRVDLYALSGRATYHEHDEKVQADAGKNEEHSFTTPADHCDSCIEQEELGWVAIGTCIPIGARTCRGRCCCRMEYR